MTPTAPPPVPLSKSCQLATLASGLVHPSYMAASNDAVYVVGGEYPTTETITRVPLSGGAPSQVVSLPMSNQWISVIGLTADSSSVYWGLDDGSVHRTSSDGATDQLLVPPSQNTFIASFVLDGGNLVASLDQDAIVSVPISGGPRTTLRQGQDTSFIVSLSLDATNFYWVNCNHDGSGCSVLEAPRSGGASTTVAHVLDAHIVGVTGNAPYVVNRGSWEWTPNSGQRNEGNGSVFTMPLGPGQKPETLAWGLGSPLAAADASGVYWGAGLNAWQTPPPINFSSVPITRRSANGVFENVALDVAVGDIVPCNGGICWSDVKSGTVTRAVCEPNASPPSGTPSPLAVCNDFCGVVGDCAGGSCDATCDALVAAPCESQGAALAVCLEMHFDELSCAATGCDAETQALSACRGPQVPPTMMGGGGGTGPLGCESDAFTSSGELWGLCTSSTTGVVCTCYVNHTPVGSCTPNGCDPSCCNSAYGNASG